MHIELPENVKNIIHALEDHGHEAYAVGGCVRDSVIGRIPADWDITTSAKPEEVKAIFPHTIDTGIQHGTVTIMMKDYENGPQPHHLVGYEVTTYRIDGEYLDGRHPSDVTFTSNLVEDLKRRDFTINAMAYSDARGLVDEFDGVGDLERGIIRCVGEPKERFTEDALRMLRAVRFAAQLGFSLDPATAKAMEELSENLKYVSAERIQVELVKMITSRHPELMKQAYQCGLTEHFLPEFDLCMETPQNTIHHCMNVGDHIISVMANVPQDKVLRLAALLHDIAKPVCRTTDDEGVDHFKGHPAEGAEMAKKILRRLKFDNDTIKRVSQLVKYHDERPILDERHVRRAIVRIGQDAFPDLFALKYGDMQAQSMYHRGEKLEEVDQFQKLWEKIKAEDQCLSIKDLAVNGSDLLALGVPQGRELGLVLQALLEVVLDNPNNNNREFLLQETKFIETNTKNV